MKKNISGFGALAATVLLGAAPLTAQNINCSDCGSGSAPVSGIFTPAMNIMIPLSFISTFSAQLSSGSLISSISNAAIAQSAGSAILALLNGSPGGLEAVQNNLNLAGAPTGPTADLMKAMAGVTGGGTRTISRSELENLTTAYNAMIRASTSDFLNSGSAILLGIHATIQAFLNAAGSASSASS